MEDWETAPSTEEQQPGQEKHEELQTDISPTSYLENHGTNRAVADNGLYGSNSTMEQEPSQHSIAPQLQRCRLRIF